MMIIGSGQSDAVAAPGTVLYSKTTSGAWSYTHSNYGAQTINIKIWGGGEGGSQSTIWVNDTIGSVPLYTGGGAGAYSSENYAISAGGIVSGTVGAGGVAGLGNGGNTTCTQTGQTSQGGGVPGSSQGGIASGGSTNTSGGNGAASNPGPGSGGASPNGGASQESLAAGNAPGGGGYGNFAGAAGKVLITAV